MQKDYLSIKAVVKNLRNQPKIKTLGTCSNSYQFLFPNYSPFSL